MQLTIHRTAEAFDSLAGEWNGLLARSITDVPFLRVEYLRAWWSTRGGGEWPSGDLWLVSGHDGSGALAGLAPLFVAPTREGRRGLMLLGSVEISDYLDLIVRRDRLDEFAGQLLDGLDRHGPAGWEVIDLFNLPESSPSLVALELAARARGWKAVRQRLQPCPVIRLPSDWEAYLASLDRKQRHELRRKMRRSESHPTPVNWRIIGPQEDLHSAIDTFLGLMALDPHKAGFLTEAMRAQFHASLSAAQANGWLQLALLSVGESPAAGYLNFDYGGRVWVYNSGLDPGYLDLSPGWVLLGHLIRWAIENGRSEFDFLRGEEDYKFRLGGVARHVERLTLIRSSAG